MLTEHQTSVKRECLKILRHSNFLVIKGKAGVGKTFMVSSLIRDIIHNNNIIPSYKAGHDIILSAPTNKAVRVLKSKNTLDIDINFLSTHAALKCKRVIDNRTGIISFRPSYNEKYPPLKYTKIIVVDEASMLNTELLKILESFVNDYNVKCIFLGDQGQLNPVKEEESPVFYRNYPTVELTEIIRQSSDNPIIPLSRNLNLMYEHDTLVVGNKGFTTTVDYNRVIDSLAKVNGSDEIKYLAWTNANVDFINKTVRQRIYTNPHKVELGETLVFDEPYKENYITNEEIKVNSLKVKEVEYTYLNDENGVEDDIANENIKGLEPKYKKAKFKVYLINNDIVVIHEESEKDYKQIVNILKSKAKTNIIGWVDYFQFIEQFASMKYNHALTVHKAQGSTYKRVIVNIRDLKKNKNKKELDRLMYTAVTRASELLILYNK